MEIIEQIQQKTIQERLYIMEMILHSLRRETALTGQVINKSIKPFCVRKFNLGREVLVDRSLIYTERFI